MGVASIGGRVFRLDPTSVRWTYEVKVADLKTVGGKVVQVYGADIGDLVVTGAFGAGGWREQVRFLGEMQKIGATQVANALSASSADPVSFIYPTKNWNFLVYLKEFGDPDGGSVSYSNTNFNPKWTLTLQVADDGDGALRTMAMDSFIARLSDGVGWKRTDYNGILTADEQAAVAQGLSIYDTPEKEVLGPPAPAPEQTPAPAPGPAAAPPPAPPPPPPPAATPPRWQAPNYLTD